MSRLVFITGASSGLGQALAWRFYQEGYTLALIARRTCLRRQGVPDVVIACAGISIGVDTSVRGDIEVIARTFATNNTGTAATFHPFMEAMVGRGSGILVGIGSVNGIRGFPGHGANGPSKAALISYCECLRGELRGSGVKVVTLCPGYVDTPLTRRNPYAMPFRMSARTAASKSPIEALRYE